MKKTRKLRTTKPKVWFELPDEVIIGGDERDILKQACEEEARKMYDANLDEDDDEVVLDGQ